MNINFQHLYAMQGYNRSACWVAAILFVLIGGCTEKQIDEPHVLELRAIPKSITLSDKYFYPKPFSIRAKYSDKTEKNISPRVSWLSENIVLLSVNEKGELQKNADCLQKKCIVSLVATDPESGKSIRLTVNMSPKKVQSQRQKVDAGKSLLDLKQKRDISESVLEPEEQDESTVKEKTGDSIQNLQFSPQVGSIQTATPSLVSTTQLQQQKSLINQLIFEESDIELYSGQEYQAKILAIDTLDKRHLNHSISYECYVTESFNLSIILLPDCHLVAVKPGEAEIKIRTIGEGLSNIESETILKIRVKPIVIHSSQEGFSHQIKLAEHNFQIWYQVSNLDNFSHYRVMLSSNVTQGLRLFVYTHSTLQYPTCLNTIPLKFHSVACYFQVAENDVMFVVENMQEENIQANLNLISADGDLFQNQSLLNLQSPVKLVLDGLVSNFILANESGGNNKHYYTFDAGELAGKGLTIKMFDFSAQIKMSVNWSSGFCNNEMTTIQTNGVICRVPAAASGNIQIVIDGNNGEFGVLNGPAAAEGGTFYKLLVKYTE